MLGENKFLASPPQRKEGPKRTKRTVLQDLSNVSASVASWWQSGREKDAKKSENEKKIEDDLVPDAESPSSKTEPKRIMYMPLGDNGVVTPTRNALWNDEHAC